MSEPEQRGVASELLSRSRLTLFFVVLLVEFAIFFAGLLTPISVSTQQTLANQTNTQFAPINSSTPVQLVVFIFSHNLPIALAEMIPVLGALLFVFSVYSTGLVAQALAVSQGLPAQWGALIIAFPYTSVELSAYAVAVGAGGMLVVAWRRKRLRREVEVFVLESLLITAILLVAAAMEMTTIRVSLLFGFALWLPTGLVLATIVMKSWRRKA
ncbi:MAG: stage II sporulation protein M [Thaumarchaeota archaeon]|nr:stage II sporulation protein M [Nitrososphaerota archaeon]